MKEFLDFNRMITGDIIKYVYWALAGVTVIVGIITFLFSLFTGDFSGALGGLLVTLLGPVLIRIYCELMIVLFKIHETLVDIKNK
jgi:hypothetical protein